MTKRKREPLEITGEVRVRHQRTTGPADIFVLKNEIRRLRLERDKYRAALATGVVSAAERAPMENAQKRLDELKQQRAKLVVAVQLGSAALAQQRNMEASLAAAREVILKAGKHLDDGTKLIQNTRDANLRILNAQYARETLEARRASLRSQANETRMQASERHASLLADVTAQRQTAQLNINYLSTAFADVVQKKINGESAATELKGVNAEIAQIESRLYNERAMITPERVIPLLPKTSRPKRRRRTTTTTIRRR
jgi:hypothetical protein